MVPAGYGPPVPPINRIGQRGAKPHTTAEGKPMSKSKTVKFAGYEFHGATMALARATMESTIEAFVRDADLGPSFFKVHGTEIMVWPTVTGYAYAFSGGHYARPQEGCLRASCFLSGPRESAVAQAISHAVQMAWNTRTVADDAEFIRQGFAPITGNEARKQAEHCACIFDWQRKYNAARLAGHSHSVARDLASGRHAPAAA
jgi:hypothetical protein